MTDSSAHLWVRRKIITDIHALTSSLTTSSDLRAAGETFRDLVTQWHDYHGRLDPNEWLALKNEYSQACQEFKSTRDRLRQQREDIKRQRELEWSKNAFDKRALVKEAEGFAWEKATRENAARFKALQRSWREIGPAGRQVDEELWSRLRAAADDFFSRRKREIEHADEQRRRNLSKKRDLVRDARRAFDSGNWREAKEEIKSLQRQWKQIGPVPREKDAEVWKDFREACDAVFEAAHRYHINSIYEQIDKTKANINKLRDMIANLEEIQDRKRDQLSRIGGSGDWVPARIHELQISIGDLNEKILEKRRWLDEAYSRLRDLESRL